MNAIRARITPRLVDGVIHVAVEWVRVDEAQTPGEVVCAEEFRIAPHRAGCAYFSKVAVAEATELPGTFWVDEAGARHFTVAADPGRINLTAPAAGLAEGGGG